VLSLESPFVWQQLDFTAQAFIEEQQARQFFSGRLASFRRRALAFNDVHDEDDKDDGMLKEIEADHFLLDFVSRNHLVMTDFTKFRLVMQYLDGNVDLFLASAVSRHVNFGLFLEAEQGFAIDRYGILMTLLDNALHC